MSVSKLQSMGLNKALDHILYAEAILADFKKEATISNSAMIFVKAMEKELDQANVWAAGVLSDMEAR